MLYEKFHDKIASNKHFFIAENFRNIKNVFKDACNEPTFHLNGVAQMCLVLIYYIFQSVWWPNRRCRQVDERFCFSPKE